MKTKIYLALFFSCFVPLAFTSISHAQAGMPVTCNSFNASTLEITPEAPPAVVAPETMSLLVTFPDKKSGANQADNFLKMASKYKLNQFCLLNGNKGEDVIFVYFLSSGNTPSGPFPQEKCTKFTANNIKVLKSDGNFNVMISDKIVGKGLSAEDAKNLAAVLKKHGFTNYCEIGAEGTDKAGTYLWRK